MYQDTYIHPPSFYFSHDYTTFTIEQQEDGILCFRVCTYPSEKSCNKRGNEDFSWVGNKTCDWTVLHSAIHLVKTHGIERYKGLLKPCYAWWDASVFELGGYLSLSYSFGRIHFQFEDDTPPQIDPASPLYTKLLELRHDLMVLFLSCGD